MTKRIKPTMLRKIVTAIIVVPLLVIVVGFAVANRQVVTISFDPFDQTHPASSVSLPLFIVIFILLILGVLIGGTAAWLRQSQWRRRARRRDAEVRELHGEIDAMRRNVTEPAPPPEQRVPLILPPTM